MERLQLINTIKYSLGYPTVNLEINDEVIESFIDSSVLLLSGYVEVTRYEEFPASEYIPFDKGVVISVTSSDSSGIGSSSSYENIDETQIRVIRNPCGLSFSSKDYIISKALSAQQNLIFKKSYRQIDKGLYLYNYTLGKVLVEYVPNEIVYEDLDPSWQFWVSSYTTALSKIALGRIRGKYRAGSGPFELDGETLLQEGNEEKQRLEEDLYERGHGLFIVDSE